MPGFIRRYNFFPSLDVISLIEGAVIIDAPPPGAIKGISTGVAALVGEFADMTYGVSVDASGNVTTNPQPTEVFSSQDLLNKFGGFDETLGEFGVSGGNGFVALRNKKFSRLILVAINLASSKGIRAWRNLPTNASATNPTPVVPVQGGTVAAGREFKSGANRVRLCQAVTFSSAAAYESGTDGSVTTAAAAVTQTFTAASGLFTTIARPDGATGVKVGDILVLGQIGGAGGLGSNAGTYRVNAITNATTLVVEKMDGSSFAFTTTASLPWRIHPGSAADSAPVGNSITAAGGALIPARPLDATIAAATVLTPTVVPPVETQTSWDPLSSLGASAVSGLTFTAAVQAPNAVASASFETLYTTALQSLLSDSTPARDVNLVWCARVDSVIRSALKNHTITQSGQGVGRVVVVAPEINQVTEATVLGNSDPGVGANRDERTFYTWPGAQMFVPEAVGFNLKQANGSFVTTGILDDRMDGWLVSLLSNLPPENNPGMMTPPATTALAPILGFQSGAPVLSIGDYIALRSNGVVALRLDSTAGPIVQSGVTTSLVSGQKNIARRRMADYIQDSVAQRLGQFAKRLMTNQLKDAAVGEVVAFLLLLLSPNNPPAQRIAAFQVDSKSGNTPATLAAGAFVIIGRVQTLASADFLVFQAQIGETVNVTS